MFLPLLPLQRPYCLFPWWSDTLLQQNKVLEIDGGTDHVKLPYRTDILHAMKYTAHILWVSWPNVLKMWFL